MAHAADPDLTGLHVLVLDDNEDARAILDGYLTHLGALVTAASSAGEALDALKKIHADVIVSDLSMPGLDGHHFLQRVRACPGQKEQPTPAIALTGFGEQAQREQAWRSGFQAYMVKPIDPAMVAQEIAELVQPP
jgi:CheY-like chemotaxis protein